MMDEFKKQLAAISGQDIGDINFHSNEEISEVNKRFDSARGRETIDSGSAESDLIQKELEKFGEAGQDFSRSRRKGNVFIKDLHNDIGESIDNDSDYGKGDFTRRHKDKANKAININFMEGDYPFYYKGKNETLVGKIKGNQVIDVKTFTNENSKMTVQDFAKGKVGDAYRLEKEGKGIYYLNQEGREGYDFLNFQKPTEHQVLSTKDGFKFGTSSLEDMDAAFRDRSSIEALNYLGVELNAYESKGGMLRGNGQVTFRGEIAGSTLTKPISGNALIQSMNAISGSTLLSNQNANYSTTKAASNFASNVLDSNGSLAQKVGKLLKKVF